MKITLFKLATILPIFLSLFFCCSPKEPGPNIRVIPGIEFCAPACDKMQNLYDNGDEACFSYVEIIIVDEKEMNCTQFCEYEHNNSVGLNPKCIYEQIDSCTEIPAKCEE